MKILSGCALNLWLLAVPLAAAEPGAGAAPFPVEGLAARYVGDVGIERDPQVIFAENFEEASPEAL